MTESRFDPKNNPQPDHSDPNEPKDIAPTPELLQDLLSQAFSGQKFEPQESQVRDSALDPELLDFLEKFVSARYTALTIKPLNEPTLDAEKPAEDINVVIDPEAHEEHKPIWEPSFDVVEKEWTEQDDNNLQNLKDLLAIKVNSAALDLYLSAAILGKETPDQFQQRRIRINEIESLALDTLNNKPKSEALSLVHQVAAAELVSAAQDLSAFTSNSKVVNMNSPQVNVRYIAAVANFMMNYTPELRENAHVLVRYTGESIEATVYGFGSGAKQYLLQLDVEQLKTLKDPALSHATAAIMDLGDFAQKMSELNQAHAIKNIIPLVEASIGDEAEEAA